MWGNGAYRQTYRALVSGAQFNYYRCALFATDWPILSALLSMCPWDMSSMMLDVIGRTSGIWWCEKRPDDRISSSWGPSARKTFFFSSERARVPELRENPDQGLAERIWTELKARGETHWAGWAEAWAHSSGLLLEYVHLLTQGRRLVDVLQEQSRSALA